MTVAEQISNGEVCAMCMLPFNEVNGFPCICEDPDSDYAESCFDVDRRTECS